MEELRGHLYSKIAFDNEALKKFYLYQLRIWGVSEKAKQDIWLEQIMGMAEVLDDGRLESEQY